MRITRTSSFSGVTRTMDLPITSGMVEAYNKGALIQEAFPHLSDSQREFYMTGVTQEEWEEVFPPEFFVEFEDDVMYS